MAPKDFIDTLTSGAFYFLRNRSNTAPVASGRFPVDKQGNSEILNFLLLTAGALAALSCLMSVVSVASNLALLQRYGSGPLVGMALRSIPWMFLWAAIAVAGFFRWKYTLPILAVLSPALLIFAVRPFFYRTGLGNPVLLLTLVAGAILKLSLSGIGIFGTFLLWKESQAKPASGDGVEPGGAA